MKKHPVDDLFKRKLSELDKQPSSAAWLKIAENNKAKPSAPRLIWYAAASIIVALLAGYAIWENSGPETRPPALANNVTPVNNDQPVVADLTDKDSLPIISAENKKQTIIAAEKIAKHQVQEEADVVREITIKDKEIDGSQREVITADLKEIPSTGIEHKSEEVNPLALKSTQDIQLERELREIQDKVEPSRTVLVILDTDNNVVQKKEKASRLSKVFRQLKNVRDGEKVDWNEVGFNPKGLVARVDDRLREGEERVSEKYHNIKEKTKL